MERSLIKEVNKKSMAARLNTSAVMPMVFPNMFGIKQRDNLMWETLVGEKGVPVMADVISFDSKAPNKTREVVNKMSGTIPKIAIERSMNESDYNTYINLSKYVQGDAGLKSLLDLAFADFDFCYNGVRGRMEYLALQAASKATINLSKTNNGAGLITETAIDFGVPLGNKTAVGTVWSTSATATPLDNIETKIEAIYNATGRVVRYVIMDQSDFANLKKCTDTINKVKAYINTKDNYMVTKETINAYMLANMNATIVTVRASVRNESAGHARTSLNPWNTGYVLFSESMIIGDIQHGPIAVESNAEAQKISTMVKQDFVLMSKYSTLNPFKEWTTGEANAFPVLNDPTGLFYLKVDGTSWS